MGKYYYSVGRDERDPARQAEIKIKRSTFICTLQYAETMETAKAFIASVARENKTATHNCWAYVVGDRGEISHSSDAGEPAGTAGKPMLNALQRHDMTCVAAVVTRHYGGVKLGVRGLIEAYGLAVDAAVESAPLVRLVRTVSYRVTLPYNANDTFLSRLKPFRADVLETDYAEKISHVLAVEQADKDRFDVFLSEHQRQGILDFIREKPVDKR